MSIELALEQLKLVEAKKKPKRRIYKTKRLGDWTVKFTPVVLIAKYEKEGSGRPVVTMHIDTPDTGYEVKAVGRALIIQSENTRMVCYPENL